MDPSELDGGIKDDVDYYIEVRQYSLRLASNCLLFCRNLDGRRNVLTFTPTREQSAADDEGAVGVDDEFDIYEDLNLDAILVAAGAEDGIVTSLDPTGALFTSNSHLTFLITIDEHSKISLVIIILLPRPLGAVAGVPLSPDSAVRVGDAPVEIESTGEMCVTLCRLTSFSSSQHLPGLLPELKIAAIDFLNADYLSLTQQLSQQQQRLLQPRSLLLLSLSQPL
jgi:hypothetical protein